MALGRPTKRPRSKFGQRLYDLRQHAGLSQQQVSERLGMSQRAYSHWERREVALRADQLNKLAEALGVSLDNLIGEHKTGSGKRGPKSQLELQVEVISKLPRSKQQQIINVIEALITQHRNSAQT